MLAGIAAAPAKVSMEYNQKDDWEINKHVLEFLVRAWFDTSKIRIATTKGNVEIKGNLLFTGQGKQNVDSPVVVMNLLKKVDSALKGIPKVRTVKYEFTGWKKSGIRWEYNPTKEQEKHDPLFADLQKKQENK